MRSWKTVLASVVLAGLALTGCSNADEPEISSEAAQSSPEATATESVDIATDTAAGEESQRIVDLLNAEEDTTAEDWEATLHPSFTEEVSVDELVDLVNQNLRPAQPFTVSNYEGGDRQAVTTLTSPVSDPLDMTVTVDPESLITGLFFGESTAG